MSRGFWRRHWIKDGACRDTPNEARCVRLTKRTGFAALTLCLQHTPYLYRILPQIAGCGAAFAS
jgi:hypothetical protein